MDGFLKKCECGSIIRKDSLRNDAQCARCGRTWEKCEDRTVAA